MTNAHIISVHTEPNHFVILRMTDIDDSPKKKETTKKSVRKAISLGNLKIKSQYKIISIKNLFRCV